MRNGWQLLDGATFGWYFAEARDWYRVVLAEPILSWPDLDSALRNPLSTVQLGWPDHFHLRDANAV